MKSLDMYKQQSKQLIFLSKIFSLYFSKQLSEPFLNMQRRNKVELVGAGNDLRH